ncbi:hypothetical protein FB45DRAFT_1148856 [Roridomyces roridus]|uniref:Uncharacterized protein n=1 Tax=Roridomyces roridus TaxID=1738132 RepID=A0AAD7FRI1_9AGAR|nr:hypothetical protein FB45DRAFT_1148856 [Roridomyces roridus]
MNANALGVPPDIQLASSDPLAWEDRWDQVFAVVNGQRIFSSSPAAWTVQTLATSPNMQDPKHRDDVIRCTRSQRKTLCDIQAQLTSIAAPSFLGNDLQDRWMSAGPSKRGEIILAGLVAACTTVPSLHEARLFCDKEIRVESHRQNGRLFLDLLEEMMVQNPTAASPDTPTYVAHPVWDAIVADQQASNATICEKIALADILSERNLLIGQDSASRVNPREY